MLAYAAAALAALVAAALYVVYRRRAPRAPPPSAAPPSTPQRRPPAWLQKRGAVILDANNVRGALGFECDLVDLGAVARRARAHADRPHWIVCCDHGPRHSALDCGDVVVSFSGPKYGQPYASADDMIVSDVGRLALAGCPSIVVITTDRELTRRCRWVFRKETAGSSNSNLQVVRSDVFADWLEAVGAVGAAGANDAEP
eukprot:CAMPEP_0119265936 /NCGR_PEP_ID=MMETSP1329-20130426/4597_1 /TAXON_ID=114041 /ORGANISM="Genus nov. species nov., Strain RCC1024" /LENGTH=199 /DNA_ID=CAMNT_0007265793 /DNA_START=46 /DNA_END=641 /DNA_ORIENTATION=-